ncbi:hypothetical protein SUDANB15_07406 (plasmid) [Streptomyces sp. enrichment culture]
MTAAFETVPSPHAPGPVEPLPRQLLTAPGQRRRSLTAICHSLATTADTT